MPCHGFSECCLPQVAAEAAQGSADDEGHEAEPTEPNGKGFEVVNESEDSADEPEMLPDSWETMAEEGPGHESAQESTGTVHSDHVTDTMFATPWCMMPICHLPAVPLAVQLAGKIHTLMIFHCGTSAILYTSIRLSKLTNSSMACRCFLGVI